MNYFLPPFNHKTMDFDVRKIIILTVIFLTSNSFFFFFTLLLLSLGPNKKIDFLKLSINEIQKKIYFWTNKIFYLLAPPQLIKFF